MSWSFCIPSQIGPMPGTWQGLSKLLTNEQKQRRSRAPLLSLTLPQHHGVAGPTVPKQHRQNFLDLLNKEVHPKVPRCHLSLPAYQAPAVDTSMGPLSPVYLES